MGSPRVPYPNPQNLWIYHMAKYADMTKLRIFQWKDYLSGYKVITRVLIRRKWESKDRKDNVKRKTKVRLRHFEGGRDHKSKNAYSLQKLEKARKRVLPSWLQKQQVLPIPWFQHIRLIQTSDLQNYKRINLCFLKSLNMW